MRKIISDYDGVMIETEFAKAYGWYLVCLALKGSDTDITTKLLEEIFANPVQTEQALRQLMEARKSDLEIAKSCAGGTTFDFGKRIWQRFYTGDQTREPNEEEIRFINGVLTPTREKVRDTLIDWFAEPIEGNLRFFKELYDAMKDTYHDAHPIGLVNQSKSRGLKKQFDLKRDGQSIWTTFPELPTVFGAYGSNKGFPYAECAGDGGLAYKGVPKGDVKSVAYRILCGKLHIQPNETMSFEDTKDGVTAAKRSGVVCVGVSEPKSMQDLSEADFTIHGTLDEIIDAIPLILRGTPSEVVKGIRDCLAKNL